MSGIRAAAAYLPLWRLDRREAGIGRGTRSVASFDEDTTSIGVEAARRLVDRETRDAIDSVMFCTTTPAYADRTNASAIHAALDLAPTAGAYDVGGSVRSVVAAIRAASDAADRGATTLVVASDVRVGLPGSADERDCGDGGAALLFGPGDDAAPIIGHGTASAEFLDRWRVPGESHSRVWEERFGEAVYVPLALDAFASALKDSGLAAGDVDHVVVTGLHRRAALAAASRLGADPGSLMTDLHDTVGVTGAAHPLLLLTHALEQAKPGSAIALLVLSDGAECVIVRAASAPNASELPSVQSQTAGLPVKYQDMLVWRGLLQREPPRRPDPDRPAAPPSSRNAAWKFALAGSECSDCHTRHLPPERVCLSCRSHDRMESISFSTIIGTITTFTIDHLAFSVAPPVVVVVVDFDGGGRIQCELTDVDPADVAVGDRVQMTFRRFYTTADGVHNYFWKARPLSRGGH